MTKPITRRGLLAGVARLGAGAVALAALSSAPPVAFAQRAPDDTNRKRAIELYEAMQRHFYLSDKRLYREANPEGEQFYPYSYLWPFTEAMTATLDLALLSDSYESAVRRRTEGLEAYWQQPEGKKAAYSSYVNGPLGHGGDRFYDDNNWVGRALVQLCQLRNGKDEAALERAGRVFDFIVAGWDPSPTNVPLGGVFWVEGDYNRDRGTGPTAGGAKLALGLFELTGASGYREWGVRMYNWTRTHLYDPNTNLYWDKFTDGQGTIFGAYWSYAQGLIIAASVQMFRLTGDLGFLGHAEQVASAMLSNLNTRGYSSQPTIFNALFFRYLLLLYAVNRQPAYLDAMRSFAETLWNDRAQHDQATHLYKDPYDWARSPAHLLLDQAAMVQLYACLALVDAGKDLTKLA